MKKEYALTILLSNPLLDDIALKKIEHILKSTINWNIVFHISLNEKTSFIVCKNLIQYHYFWMLPDSLSLFWKTAYIGNIKRNQEILNYYSLIIDALQSQKIFVIPCSGIMLLEKIYKEMLGIRQLHDIDLLTKPENLPYIEETMTKLNFTKTYINDKVSLSLPIYDVLYSKYIDANFINCNYIYSLKNYPQLYTFLYNYIKDNKEVNHYNTVQAIILYLNVAQTWNNKYYQNNIKQYNYSKLIDLYLFKKLFDNLVINDVIDNAPNSNYIKIKIKDIDLTLDFLEKEGYL